MKIKSFKEVSNWVIFLSFRTKYKIINHVTDSLGGQKEKWVSKEGESPPGNDLGGTGVTTTVANTPSCCTVDIDEFETED